MLRADPAGPARLALSQSATRAQPSSPFELKVMPGGTVFGGIYPGFGADWLITRI